MCSKKRTQHPFFKTEKKMKVYLKIIPYFRKHKFLLLIMFLSSFLFSFTGGITLTMIPPFLHVLFGGEFKGGNFIIDKTLVYIEDILITSSPMESMKRFSFLIIGLFGLKALLGYLSRFFAFWIQEIISRDLRNVLFSKFLNLPLSYFSNKKTGSLTSRFTYDLSVIRYALTEGVFSILRDSLSIFVYFLVALWASPYLSLVAFVVLPFAFFLIQFTGKVLRRRAKRAQERMGEIGARSHEILQGIKIIKAFDAQEKEKQKFKNETHRYFKAHLKYQHLSILSPHLSEFIGAILAAVFLYTGGLFIFYFNILTPDRFFVFLAASLSMLHPFKKLTNSYANIQQGVSALERTFKVLEEEEEKGGNVVFKGLKDKIVFKNVYFSYDSRRWVLRDINIEFEKGRVYAFVGPSGAGKSTLLSLIPRFYDPQKGCILVDGLDLREYDIRSLRRKIGVVTQDVLLFSGTIKENLFYGNSEAGEKELKKAIESSALDEFISKLPKGIDTPIEELGKSLSGGEKQRLSIARVFLKNPDILILDEFTSQLDAHSEYLIKEALYNLFKDRTVFVIAHRLSTILKADLIVLMDKGKIVDKGTHEELLKREKLYKKLYTLQFEEKSSF